MHPPPDPGCSTTNAYDVVVVGRGAIGTLLAARLARAKLSVGQVSSNLQAGIRKVSVREGRIAWHATVTAEHRLQVDGTIGARLLILALKTPQLHRWLQHLQFTDLDLLPIVVAHNGLLDLATAIPPVCQAVVNATVDCEGDAVICHAFDAILLSENALRASAGSLRSALIEAGFQFLPHEMFEVERWLKLVVATTGARMTLSDVSIGDALADCRLRSQLADIVNESGRVITAVIAAQLRALFAARCNDLEMRFRTGMLFETGPAAMRCAYPSLHRDLERRRETEIEALNGAIVALASRVGIEAPLNRFLRDEVRLMTKRAATPPMAAQSREMQQRLRSAFAEVRL